MWQSAEIALVTVAAGNAGLVQARLEAMVQWIERHAVDVQVVDAALEMR